MYLRKISYDVIPLALVCLLVYFIIAKVKGYKNKGFSFHFVRYCLLSTFMIIFFLTILWGGISLRHHYLLYNFVPFQWVRETYSMGYGAMIKQLVLNVGMFMPLGFFFPMVFHKRNTILVGFLTSLCIEIIQLPIGRSCDIDDLIMNTLGVVIGYMVYRLLFSEKQKEDKESVN